MPDALGCDRGPPTVVDDGGAVVHAEYVDNFGAMGTWADTVEAAVEGTREHLQSRGLVCHAIQGPDVKATFIAVDVDDANGTVRVGTRRAWRLRMAFDFALQQTHLNRRKLILPVWPTIGMAPTGRLTHRWGIFWQTRKI